MAGGGSAKAVSSIVFSGTRVCTQLDKSFMCGVSLEKVLLRTNGLFGEFAWLYESA